MDSFEWNKIFGAVLATAFIVLSLTFGSQTIFATHKPAQEGYALEGASKDKTTTTTKTKDEAEPASDMMANMELAHGAKVAKKCSACHVFEANGKNKVGPVLYDIVNRQIASISDFKYSTALKEYGEGKVWNYEELNQFLYKPKKWVKGTSMAFAGIKKVEDRAALLLYLRSLSENPAELPPPAEQIENESGS